MGQLRIPDGAEGAVCIQSVDAFDCVFTIHIYGAKRRGWFIATYRSPQRSHDSGTQQLPRGEWQMLLHLIDRCGFWSLPEDGSHLNPSDPEYVTDDGEWLTVMAHIGEKFHRVHRSMWREWGFDALLSFGARSSGFFVRHPRSGGWMLLEGRGPAPEADADE